MDYKRVRGRRTYRDLVRLTTKSYLQAKISSAQLQWAPDLRIAFAVKRNALAVLQASSHFSFGCRQEAISPRMIAVNEAGYPDGARLREIYGLHGHAPP